MKPDKPTPAAVARDHILREGNRLLSRARDRREEGKSDAAGRELAANLILSIPVMARLLIESACRACGEPLTDISRGCASCLPGKTQIQETFTRALTAPRVEAEGDALA